MSQQRRVYRDDELVYAAYARCCCGAGLAHRRGCGAYGDDACWDCSDILTDRAHPAGHPEAKTHDGSKPFVFWEIKSESQPSANGATTRPGKALPPEPHAATVPASGPVVTNAGTAGISPGLYSLQINDFEGYLTACAWIRQNGHDCQKLLTFSTGAEPPMTLLTPRGIQPVWFGDSIIRALPREGRVGPHGAGYYVVPAAAFDTLVVAAPLGKREERPWRSPRDARSSG